LPFGREIRLHVDKPMVERVEQREHRIGLDRRASRCEKLSELLARERDLTAVRSTAHDRASGTQVGRISTYNLRND
jgi:hypothetical protein